MCKSSPLLPRSMYPGVVTRSHVHFLKCEAITGVTVPREAHTHTSGRMQFPHDQSIVGDFSTLFLDVQRIPSLLDKMVIFYYCLLLLTILICSHRSESKMVGWPREELQQQGGWERACRFIWTLWRFSPKQEWVPLVRALITRVFTNCFWTNRLGLEPQPS